ncbi:acyltransferase family protein [Emticicia sp. 17c]|uniref:acyltransferase family protein n=1 Tax=Emticicia sp. 17c TaxID=3127704 RepID=UPI00301E1EB9
MTTTTTPPPPRLASADVYRGFVMLLMMAEVLRFHKISEALPESGFWRFLAHHQEHVEWVGCSLHDLIQPSFSFLVGVVLPYSIASRLKQETNFWKVFRHALWRSLILILLGIFLRSQWATQTKFTFEDTLTQIGLGYPFLFLLGFRSFRTQMIALGVILAGYWLAFALYPLPDAQFDYNTAGAIKDWEHNLTGFAAHWNKNTNLAWAFDRWFLNLFPREKPFLYNGGGYATLSFIPTLGTMLIGLIAGNILKSDRESREKLKLFLILGVSGVVLGTLLNWSGICPNVKRIWTPTWVIFSGGWCFLLLSFFFWSVDILQKRKWFFFLTVIGMNSIAAYVIAHTVDSYISDSLKIHLGQNYASILGDAYQSLIHGGLILLFEWLILKWMYDKKLFIRI